MFWFFLGPLALIAAVVFYLRYQRPIDADETGDEAWRESLEDDDEPYDPEYDAVDDVDEVDDDYDTNVREWG